MSFLNTADDMADKSIELLSDVYDSKFATHLQGNGTPVLTDYFNIDDTLSSTDLGSYTVDQVLGGNSPLRYNEIKDFPLFGLREMIPNMEELDGQLMDLAIDGEVITLPNTIKPTPMDMFVYQIRDIILTFRIDNIEFTSIKSNNYYKLSISLRDINTTDTLEKLRKQTVKVYTARVDNIGTQDKCIIEDTINDEINMVQKTISYLTEEYLINFYDTRYNCLLLRDTSFGFPIYDPFLTLFVERNDILEQSNQNYVITNFDYRRDIDKVYKLCMYRYLELRNTTHLSLQYMEPATFKTFNTNPFSYYGEESVFTLDVLRYKNDQDIEKLHIYGNKDLVNSIIFYDYPEKEVTTSRPSKEVMKDDIEPPVYRKKPTEMYSGKELLNKVPEMIDGANRIDYHNHDVHADLLSNDDLSDIYDDDNDIYEESSLDELVIIPKKEEREEPVEVILEPFYLNYIKNYLVKDTLFQLFTPEDIDNLMNMDILYNETDFMHIPMLIFVLKKYISYLYNNK